MNSACNELVDVLKGLQIGDNQKRARFEEKLMNLRDQEGFVVALVTISNSQDQVGYS